MGPHRKDRSRLTRHGFCLRSLLSFDFHCFILDHLAWKLVFGFAMGGNFLQRETLLIQAAFGAQFRKLPDLWQVRRLIGA